MDIGRDISVHNIETPTNGRVLMRQPHGEAIGVLVGFHGYAEHAEIQLERLAAIPGAQDWLLVAVQALNRFYRGRSRDTVAGWMTRQDRDLAIAANIVYTDRVMERVRTSFQSPVSGRGKGDSPLKGTVPLLYAGFSQGTAMAFRAAVRGRWGADGVIGAGADVPPELLEDPESRFPPTLLIRGAQDEWYTQQQLDADVAALGARGVSVTPAVIHAGHEWTPEAAAHAAEFMKSISAVRKSRS